MLKDLENMDKKPRGSASYKLGQLAKPALKKTTSAIDEGVKGGLGLATIVPRSIMHVGGNIIRGFQGRPEDPEEFRVFPFNGSDSQNEVLSTPRTGNVTSPGVANAAQPKLMMLPAHGTYQSRSEAPKSEAPVPLPALSTDVSVPQAKGSVASTKLSQVTTPTTAATLPTKVEEPAFAVETQAVAEPTLPESRNQLGKMSLNQGVRLAGTLAAALAPDEWSGKMGKSLAEMANESEAEQRRLDELKYAQDYKKFETADERIYGEKVGKQERLRQLADFDRRNLSRLNELEQAHKFDIELQDRANRFSLANRAPVRPTEYESRVARADDMYKKGLISKDQYTSVVLDTKNVKPDVRVIDKYDEAGMKVGQTVVREDSTGYFVDAMKPQQRLDLSSFTPEQKTKAVAYSKANPNIDKATILQKIASGEI